MSYDPDDLQPEECKQLAEYLNVLDDLGQHQEKLERVVHDDPVGAVWFGDDDAWWDKRLRRNAPQRGAQGDSSPS